jgi:hypothetical protein
MPRLSSIGLLVLAVWVSACGSDDASQPVASDSPVASFAPLVRLDARDEGFPTSVELFLRSSTLEWSGGPCRGEVNVAAGPASQAETGEEAPRLDPRRLGRYPGYLVRARDADCSTRRQRPVYSTIQRTRPFDRDGRPAGLRRNEGFNLDILTDAQGGVRTRGDDGALKGAPAYYATEPATVDGRRGLRIGYWLLYGRGNVKHPRPDMPDYHEGDWERVEALVTRGPDGYQLDSVRYLVDGRWRTRSWRDVELAGGTHPVVLAARGTHALAAQESCDSCVDWPTWKLLRDVRREPWFGYAGGWGANSFRAAVAGPLGPTPFEIDRRPGRSDGSDPVGPAGDVVEQIQEVVDDLQDGLAERSGWGICRELSPGGRAAAFPGNAAPGRCEPAAERKIARAGARGIPLVRSEVLRVAVRGEVAVATVRDDDGRRYRIRLVRDRGLWALPALDLRSGSGLAPL